MTVALSGGADSVALLRGLLELKQQTGGPGIIRAAHVNHHLREDSSTADEHWCRELCQQLEVPLQVLQADPLRASEASGDGVEAAARELRYRLLTQAAEGTGARYLTTAHTEDDQAETVLMRILRGSGLRGLSGIPRTRPLTPTLSVVRPLLDCSRGEVESYLASINQSFRTDPTNLSPQFTRNRVRHTLLPLLRDEFNPEINKVLLRLATQAQESQQNVVQQARQLLKLCDVQHEANGVSLRCESWKDQPAIVIGEALRIVWRDANLAEQAMTYQWWQRLSQLGTDPNILNLPGDVRAEVIEGRLTLSW